MPMTTGGLIRARPNSLRPQGPHCLGLHSSLLAGPCLSRQAQGAGRFPNYRYFPLTTRGPENQDNKVYIQDLIESGVLEEDLDLTLDPSRMHFFLCGNPAMIGLPEWDGDTPTSPRPAGSPRSSSRADSSSITVEPRATSTTKSIGDTRPRLIPRRSPNLTRIRFVLSSTVVASRRP